VDAWVGGAAAPLPTDHSLYVPILKAKMGELNALSEVRGEERALLPVLELVPTGIDDADSTSIEKDMRTVADRLVQRWRSDQAIGVDVGFMSPEQPLNNGLLPITFAMREMEERGSAAIPVVRPVDAPEVLAAVRERVLDEGKPDLIVRLSASDLDGVTTVAGALDECLLAVGAERGAVSLVLDLGPTPVGTAPGLLAQVALFTLEQIPGPDEWRSLTVASGAFPTTLTAVPAGVVERLSRDDWELWKSIAERVEARAPGFGDYAIAHPAITQGTAFAPAPQIRYTADDAWIALRGRKIDPRGSARFYDICAELRALPVYSGPEFSWGDEYIWKAAESADGVTQVGPGNATTWRSIGTSHHLAFVVNRLANYPAA
jgi:hypothetical protein